MFISLAHAQDAATAAVAAAPSPMSGVVPLLLMFVVFYFLLIRPQQKKYKEHQGMVSALRKGDRVITSGGIVGVISKVETDTDLLQVDIAEGVTVKVVRGTVASIVVDGKTAVEAPAPAKSKKKAS